jgi:hypothetical protein
MMTLNGANKMTMIKENDWDVVLMFTTMIIDYMLEKMAMITMVLVTMIILIVLMIKDCTTPFLMPCSSM